MRIEKGERKESERALIKKAMGYTAEEVTEEFVVGDEGEEKLNKRKVARKEIPADLAAIKLALCELKPNAEFDGMSDEQLAAMREKYLLLLKQLNEGEKNGNGQ